MKKNAMLKIAAILMVAVLLTTCAISSTFAKYSTSGNVALTSARVAKWGITVTADTTNNLFGESYGTDEDTLYVETSTEGQKVVAPGTTGSAPSFTVSGTAEVDVEITATADVELSNWYLDMNEATPSDVYCPLAVKVGDAAALTIGDTETLDAFEARIEAAIVKAFIGNTATIDTSTTPGTSSSSKAVAANNSLGTTGVSVSWEWALGAASEDDTTLGTNAVTSGKEATISISYGVTVEQVGATPNSSPVYVAPATP